MAKFNKNISVFQQPALLLRQNPVPIDESTVLFSLKDLGDYLSGTGDWIKNMYPGMLISIDRDASTNIMNPSAGAGFKPEDVGVYYVTWDATQNKYIYKKLAFKLDVDSSIDSMQTLLEELRQAYIRDVNNIIDLLNKQNKDDCPWDDEYEPSALFSVSNNDFIDLDTVRQFNENGMNVYILVSDRINS